MDGLSIVPAMIECIFGWGKQHGTKRKTKHRDPAGVATDFMLLIAYNLIRIPKLLAAQVSVRHNIPTAPKPQGKKMGNAPISRFFSRLLVRKLRHTSRLVETRTHMLNCNRSAS